MHSSCYFSLLLGWSVSSVLATGPGSIDLSFTDDSDLTHFVTRPDIKYPKLNVTIYDSESLASGYWFLAPYANIFQENHPSKYYQACQTGPAIYDGTGELVWAGACAFDNQNTCDFRATKVNGSYVLSGLLNKYKQDRGRFFVLNSAYHPIHSIRTPPLEIGINMHEMNVIENGRKALINTFRPRWADVTAANYSSLQAGFVADVGFRELDLETGKSTFDWWALDHVPLNESQIPVDGDIEGPFPKGYNYFHINSAEKNAEGDYMISSRYTNCIYKISGKDGTILWRLGGLRSDFRLEGFNFSAQHDARWREYSEDKEIITFLDNAANSHNMTTSSYSSALLVELDKKTMIARVLNRWVRPDQQLSHLRGNFQSLPNGNVFAGWSDNSYFSEHTADGRLLMEAQFAAHRFVTYRSYKFDFVAAPSGEPIMVASAYGTSSGHAVTVIHVSWNGQTEVRHWNFYREDRSLIGRTARTGFETMFQCEGIEMEIYAEATDAQGLTIGISQRVAVRVHIGSGISESQPSRKSVLANAEDSSSASKDEL